MSTLRKPISRRNFLVKASIGTGVMIGTVMSACNPIRRSLFDNIESLAADYAPELGPMAWFEVRADGRVTLHSPKVEMGQGVFTGLAQIAAEELEVDIAQVNIVHASTKGRPIDPRSTGGSDTISSLWNTLRTLAAKMRVMLLTNASVLLEVPVEKLSISNGVISGNGKSITYGEVVSQATEWKEPKKVTLKSPKDFKVIGKAVPRVDLKPKVFGAPIYGIDVKMPDMLYGMVARPPKIDTVYSDADTSAASGMPGVVQVVKEKDFVAVVAHSRPEAEMALRRLKINWKTNKVWNQDELLELNQVGKGKDYLIQKEGSKMGEGDDIYEAAYSTPAGAHAQMEPNGAVAHVEKDKAVVHISTQVPKYTRIEVAEALGMELEQVEIQPTYLGGGFGRRLHTPNAIQAALIAKAVGKPVHVYFRREDEFESAEFRPPSQHIVKGRLGENGLIEDWEYHVSSPDAIFGSPIMPAYFEKIIGSDVGTWAGSRLNYKGIPNIRVHSWRLQLPFSTTMWRAPGLMANTFVVESFMDEMAHRAGKDPVEFRIAHLEDTEKGHKLKEVIERAAKSAGWGKPLPKGHGLGIATAGEMATVCAQVVQASVENGEIKVHKVVCAIDPGLAINPDGIRAQVESAIIMGMSASMYEKIEVQEGKVRPNMFGPYRMATMKDAPKEIETIIIESGDAPKGVGEPPIGPIGAAIANAVFAATGKRLRNMPLNEELNK